jgi:Novel STAND NTPase 1
MSAPSVAPMPTAPKNPYVGPRAFGPDEHLPNRADAAREVTDLVIAERVVLLHSPSGAGKTSLIQAAVLRMLKADGFRPIGPVRVDKPAPEGVRNRFVYSVALYLLYQPGQDVRELQQLTLREVLVRAFPALADPQYAGPPPVLVIDQLEEVLVLDPTDWPAQQAFFQELGATLRKERLWALLAMREDYMGGLSRYVCFLPGHLRAKYRLDFLRPEEALPAVVAPAAAQGVTFTENAPRLLIDKIAYEEVEVPGKGIERRPTPYVEPFQLQVVCRQLWKEVRYRRGDFFAVIDESDVTAIDVSEALRRYYADSVRDVVAKFSVSERVLREWFETELITKQRFRRPTMVPPVTGEQEREVISRLREVNLIREDTRGGATWYELSHDRLIAAVTASNHAWRHRTLAGWQRAAYEWQRSNRQRDYLLSSAELRLIPPVPAKTLPDYERDFLQESEEAARRDGHSPWATRLVPLLIAIVAVQLVVIVILLVATF